MKYLINSIRTLSSSSSSISQYSSGKNSLLVNSYHTSPFLIRRHFSRHKTKARSLQKMLAHDVTKIYSLCGGDENLFPSMTFSHYKNLVEDILTGKYRFRPLEYLSYPLSYKNEFMDTIFPDYPDCDIYDKDKTFIVIKASNVEDSVVLKAMSVTLQRLIYGKIYICEYQFKSRFPTFLKTLSAMKCVERIHKMELETLGVNKEGLINAVMPFIGDDKYVLGLVISMLGSPIYNINGDRLLLQAGESPPLGEVNSLLLNMVLMDRFDRVFAKRFPNHRFLRFLNEIFIIDEEIYLDDESETKSISCFYTELGCFLNEIGVKGGKYQLITRKYGEDLLCGKDIHYPPKVILVKIHPCGQVIVTDTSRDERTLEEFRDEKELWTEDEDDWWSEDEDELLSEIDKETETKE